MNSTMDENVKLELSENGIKVLEKRYLKRDAEGRVIETPTAFCIPLTV